MTPTPIRVSVYQFFIVFLFFCTIAVSQERKVQETVEQRIINTVPSKVPLRVEILNGGMKSALEDIEIKITNIGNRSIYCIAMTIASAEEFAPRNRVGFSHFEIGNGAVSDFRRPFASLTAERAQTTPFEPGDTTSFRIKKIQAELSWKLMMDHGYPTNSKLVFEIYILRFDDGSGYMTPQAVEMPDPRPRSILTDDIPTGFFFL